MSSHDVTDPDSLFLITRGDTRTDTDAALPAPLGRRSFEVGGNRYDVERSVGWYGLADPLGFAVLTGYRVEEDGGRPAVFSIQEADRSSLSNYIHTSGEVNGTPFYYNLFESYSDGKLRLRTFRENEDGSFAQASTIRIDRYWEEISRFSFFSANDADYLLISTTNEYAGGSRVQLQLLSLSDEGVPSVLSGNIDAKIVQQNIVTPPMVIGDDVFVIGHEFDRTVREYTIANLISVGLDGTMRIERAFEGDQGAALLSASSLVPLEIEGITYIFTLGPGEEGVKAFALGAGGSLTDATQQLSLGELGLDGTTSLDARVVDGRAYLFTSNGVVEVIAANVDLLSSSDTGLSDTDDLTSDTTPTISFLAAAGAELEVDWDDDRGFLAAGTATGSRQDLTLDTGYAEDGLKSIQVRATESESNVITHHIDVRIGTAIANFSGLPELSIASDTGTAGDLLTSDTTPTLSMAVDAGANIAINWDDGRGFVAAGTATGVAQEFTLSTPYAEDGQKQIQARANLPFSETIQVDGPILTIDTVAPLQTKLPFTATDTQVDYSDYINYRNPDYIRGSAPDLSSVTTATVDGTKYVFADDGNLAFTLNSIGDLVAAPGLVRPDVLDATSDRLTIAGVEYRFSTGDDGINVHVVAEDGGETLVSSIQSSEGLSLDRIAALATAQVGDSSYVFVVRSDLTRGPIEAYIPPVGWNNGDIKVFSVADDGNLRFVQEIGNSVSLPLWIARSLHVAEFDGRTYVFSGSSFENGFAVFRVDSQSVELVDPSLGGIPDLDLMTFDMTPSISFGFEAGALVEIDWDNGAGFVPAGTAIGAYQEATLPAPYETTGAKAVEVRATDAAGNVTLQQLQITILAPMFGTDVGETLNGTGDSEQINGLGGNDWIRPGAGDDTIDGGAGIDMADFSLTPAHPDRTNLDFMLTLDLGAGTAGIFGGETNRLLGVENVTGTIFADVLTGDAGANRLRGLGDYDWFIATEGNDTLEGGNGLDMVSFANWGGTGSATVSDILAPFSVADFSGVRVDLSDPSTNTHLAAGQTMTSIERITGSSHQDIFFGDGGQNDFRGLGGYDVFVGSDGGRERYFGGAGIDTVSYFSAPDGVIASLRNGPLIDGAPSGYGSGGYAARDLFFSIENFIGSRHDDRLTGNDLVNQLLGLQGDDLIFGYGGNDRMRGGAGDDTINGGTGSDFAIFSGNRADYTITRSSTTDVTVVGTDGTDMLSSVEYFVFEDETANIWQFSVA